MGCGGKGSFGNLWPKIARKALHVQRGTPLQVLKELGGWETMEKVQRHAHLSADHLAHWVTPLTEVPAPKLGAVAT